MGDLALPKFSIFVKKMFAKVTEQPISVNRSIVKTMFFDFDGTIADTLEQFVNIVNRLAIEFGYRVTSPEEVDRLRQLSSQDILKVSAIPLWQIPFLIRRLKKELNREIQFLTPIPGMKTTLQQLKARGIKLGILTSNSQENVAKFLQQNGMEDLFERVYTGSSILGKDKVLRKILRQENLQPQELVYVGDETRDIDAAGKSGVRAIAVGWGFNSPRALAAHRPDFLVREPRELMEVLETMERHEKSLATPHLRGAVPRNAPQNTDSRLLSKPQRRPPLPFPPGTPMDAGEGHPDQTPEKTEPYRVRDRSIHAAKSLFPVEVEHYR
jgi:phosphoglycolate phosphatase